jgi:hypothetical protein
MKKLKYNFRLPLLLIICTTTISIQSQTPYWQLLTDNIHVYDLLYDGEQNLYFSGNQSFYTYFWRSTDLGSTWTRFGSGYLSLYRIAIDSTGILWGGNDSNGGIYKSTNQGETWTASLSSSDKIYSLTVSPNNWIWAGTNDGRVVHSADGGSTWTFDSLDNYGIRSIATNSINHVFAGIMNGRICRTTDLGLSWELVYNVTPLGIWGMVIDNQNNIYASKWTKRLISTDNGNTWTTTIEGPQLQSLYLDKYHVFYGGVLGQRSFDNCISWEPLGLGSWVNSFAFVDSLIFAGTVDGVFLHDPSYQPYIGENYFPLALGNKWQFNTQCANYFTGGNSIYYVQNDTIIEAKRYYLLQGAVNDWLRYDYDEDKLFLRWNDSDYVVMDYTLNEGSTFSHILFNNHALRTVSILAPQQISIFDSSFHSKGFWWIEGNYASYTTYYSESLGETKRIFDYEGPGGTWDYCLTKMIRAILYDSSGVNYYSDHVKPIISFQPIFVTNKFELDLDFTVNHEYTYFESNGNENFVDSVIMYSYYSNEDSTFLNQPVIATNTPNSINYSISYLLDSTLMKNEYSFYYKIYAVDKGIVPEHSTKPDSGYYELVYDPNVSVETIENNIMDYELLQNYPNPFNPITIIDYSIREEGNVELIVYDVLGKVVEKLIDERKSTGNYSAQFDASNLSSGIYFYSLRVNDFVATKKMLLIK